MVYKLVQQVKVTHPKGATTATAVMHNQPLVNLREGKKKKKKKF